MTARRIWAQYPTKPHPVQLVETDTAIVSGLEKTNGGGATLYKDTITTSIEVGGGGGGPTNREPTRDRRE